MENDTFRSEYVDHTVLHPLGLTAIIVLGLAMLLVPRRFAIVPMIIMACFISSAQRIAVFSLNFDMLRIMVLFAGRGSCFEVRLAAWCGSRSIR